MNSEYHILTFSTILTLAFGQSFDCSVKLDLPNGYVCSWGTRGGKHFAKYCCYNGSPSSPNPVINCTAATGWDTITFSCKSFDDLYTDSVCGAVTPAVAPFFPAHSGPQCQKGKDCPETLNLDDKCDKTFDVSKSEVVERHNCHRAAVSPKPKKALPKMQWNDDLALVAERWAAQCPYGHDDDNQRGLPSINLGGESWEWVGQNICYSSDKYSWSWCIDQWAAERQYFVWDKGSVDPTNKKYQVGHYTQVVANSSSYVGCGLAYCPNGISSSGKSSTGMKYVYVCNYGPGGNDAVNPYVKA